MKSFHWFLLFLIITFTVFRSVESQSQAAFISLDCGLVPENTTYLESTTNIKYKSDADYIDSGLVGKISDESKARPLGAVRSFPEGRRNCYNFNLTAKSKYLIRATFFYGNYDGINQPPSFDLYIGPNKWTSVEIDEPRFTTMPEIIHVLTQDRLQVCLVKTGDTTPFISSLELRPLNNDSYLTKGGSLNFYNRFFSPDHTVYELRYPVDLHDRVWYGESDPEANLISTDLPVFTSNSFEVPQEVMQTADVPTNASEPWNIEWGIENITDKFYVYMHFAEIQDLKANETREFTISYNDGKDLFTFFRPHKHSITTFYNQEPISSLDGTLKVTLTRTGNSTLPPLIQALEIYTVVDMLELETYKDEVSAMMNIKMTYNLSKKVSWQGDPCVPQLYTWQGLNCSYPNSNASQIISLSLKESQLTGTITSEISKLTQLSQLDLSNNDLSGEIPAFFADMKLLTLIDLSNNDLSGEIPAFFGDMQLLRLINLSGNSKLNNSVPDSLQQRINSNSLTLIRSETRKKSKTSHHIPVVAIGASVAGVFGLLVILAIIFFITRKNHNTTQGATPRPSIISKDRMISYPAVLKITNNFEKVLGKGGFGTVYHGNLDDTQVAVKMLSHSSAQGYKEFNAEVELLLRVHYIHLVGLVAYCDDGNNFALIYEYMANGDLKENLSGKRGGNVLTWGNRMQIAVEAAQGLEYLHNGCRPPMVHRDVKTANILLNEQFGAKLADFGLSRSFSVDGESHSMTVVAGTPGYLDPEYYRTNLLSEKSDVYSFGVVLLEIVTNQPVIDKTREKPHINDWVGFMLTKGDIKSIVDPKLMGDYDTNGAWKIVELALSCVKPSSNRRPAMAHIVMELNDCVALEVARRQGSEEMYQVTSLDHSLSSASEFGPGAR